MSFRSIRIPRWVAELSFNYVNYWYLINEMLFFLCVCVSRGLTSTHVARLRHSARPNCGITDHKQIEVTPCSRLFQMTLHLTITALLMLGVAPPPCWGQQVAPCTFNSMCSCKFGGGDTRGIHFTTPKSLDSVRDIICVGVPFSKLPGNS